MSDRVALRAMARWHAANPAASQPGSSSSSSSEDESDEDSGSTSSIDSEIQSDDSDVAIVRRHGHHRKKGNGLLTAADLPVLAPVLVLVLVLLVAPQAPVATAPA